MRREPKMDNRFDAAYARQSVDKKDSISIESQLEFCGHELKGGTFEPYKDKGYSGKNTDRPDFQRLLRDIRAGSVRRVVVYKLDRVSRSIIDFANMMELFQRYGVEFVSCQEKFDTATPMGRAMLNICIVFAQLERETIQQRVTDTYYSRCVKGYSMGGKTPYGFDTEPVVMANVKTKKLVANDNIENVRLAFEMYADPTVSLGDIARWYAERSIKMFGGGLQRMTLSRMLRNPIYVRADMDVYEFYKGQGVTIVNDPADFQGTNGCYIYRSRNQKRLTDDLAGQILVLAPHLGQVDSATWLRCRRKALNNGHFQPARKANRTWLAGKIKCGKCGYGLQCVESSSGVRYLRCNKRHSDKTCVGPGTIYTSAVEDEVYAAMVEKLREFKILSARGSAEANPKLTALKVELAQVEDEIEQLLDTLAGANGILISYANAKVVELDTRKQTLLKEMAGVRANEVSPERAVELSGLLDGWDEAVVEEKRVVVDPLIERITATSDCVNIEWKI
jgi:DNA invertase Pin-like site-specific DNA recombinase